MKVKTWLVSGGVLYVLSLIFFPGGGLAAEKKVYTLDESVKEALANNWKLKAKQEKINQATYVKNQARADFLPKLSTSYGYSRYGSLRTSAIQGTKYQIGSLNNYEWRGTVTQPVFKGFALISAYRLAELGIDQSDLEVQLEELDLALKVKASYFDILTADMAVETTQKAAEALESHAEVARNFYKVGMIPVNDLLQSEVQAGNAKHDLVRAQNDARLARANFNKVLSRPVSAEVDVVDIKVLEPRTGDFQEYLEKALKNRPEIKIIENNLLQTDQKIIYTESKNYPEVAFRWDYIKEGDTPSVSGGSGLEPSNWEARVGVTWTFWEWGKTYYAVKEQESVKNEIIKTKMELEENIQLQIKDAVLNIQTAEANIPITRKAVEQGEENLRVSQERYKAQVSTSTEVLDAQRYLTDARVFHFNALFQYHLAQARLQRAMGSY
ncbi:MAG: TolC family protein [Desulfobacterales bacterium]|nr:TolC family protein [Desulfobacterales bacterium]MBL7101209.1 TolC family protein [Desulfobacteraceae bacterium]MBL7172071.1 TolC family protein [Desulfobacteraceae bacterium]